MISDTITQKIAGAMKAKDEIRLSTLRLLSSALNYEKIAKQHELSQEEELAVVRREAKKRKDAIEIYTKLANSKSLNPNIENTIEKEKKELAILEEYLPVQMSDEELEKLVNEAIGQLGAKTISDMGKVIGLVMGKAQGRADGAKVAEYVKSKLV